MLLYIMLGFIGILILVAIAGNKDAKNKALDAAARIKTMELKYEDYIEKNIHDHLLEKNGLQVDPERLAQDTLKLIAPDLNGLITLINSTTYSNVEINYTATYFPNIVSLTEDYFRQSQKNKSKRLTEIEEETFRTNALDAILADIRRRLLNIDDL
ncbi:hypothetical protein [Aureispira anguillae]|uniref:Uncharacterized protein n=1 Tax=Aureispira anguillae TaxID=2864201 RepID=A0A915YGQ4_9BACT|nr:hypothetical protein [Aureispira anguillae]BDS12842.1 hypothetical protein AsAng_0035670 [Aureispira anguillae]